MIGPSDDGNGVVPLGGALFLNRLYVAGSVQVEFPDAAAITACLTALCTSPQRCGDATERNCLDLRSQAPALV
jgi:hypothetical protein